MSDERTRAELPADTGNATHEQQASGASDLGRHLHPRSAWFEPKCYLCWQDEAQKMTASALTLSDEVRTLRSQNQALQEEVAALKRGHRVCEQNMDAEIARLQGQAEKAEAVVAAAVAWQDATWHGDADPLDDVVATNLAKAVAAYQDALSPTQETDSE